MRRPLGIALGYLLAIAIGIAGAAVRYIGVDPRVVDASSGMYAFGDLLAFGFWGGLAGLVPTWFLLRELRGATGMWATLSWLALGWGVIGVAAAVVRFLPKPSAGPLTDLDGIAVLRFLPAPLGVALDALGALAAPHPAPRRRLAAAAALETFAATPWIPMLWSLTPFAR